MTTKTMPPATIDCGFMDKPRLRGCTSALITMDVAGLLPPPTMKQAHDVLDLVSMTPEVILVSDEAYDRIVEICDSDAEPSQALIDLLRRPKPWATEGITQ